MLPFQKEADSLHRATPCANDNKAFSLIGVKLDIIPKFYWQDGYGIFSVNPSEIDTVVKYVENQHEHHKKRTFRDELLAFLKKYNVEYDERYLWD